MLQRRFSFVSIVGVAIALVMSCCFALWPLGQPIAAVPLAKRDPIVVKVQLGNEAGELKFFPDHLQFQAGKRYLLSLQNPSPSKHYFTAKDFADGIWSQKVDAGNVEVKGAIHELELRSGTQADWVFVPMRAGTYTLRCTVPGHTEAGMVGTLEIMG
ncbi:MAG: plastocyanin/azurin family copper-binding protein [Thermosynechococcaceae cyanobacterium]